MEYLCRLMNWRLLLLIIGLSVGLTSCKTEFEKIRQSNDPVKILASAHKYFGEEEYIKSQTLYELVIPYYRGKEEAEDIFYNYAYSHYYLNQFILSAHYFKNFSNTFYNSDRREEAAYMAAYSHYELSPSYKLDQSYSNKAIDAFQQFINTYPSSPRVNECNQLIDEMRDKMEEKAFYSSKLYYDMGEYISAKTAFENLLADFPDTKQEEEVRFLLAKSSYLLAENSVYDKKERRFKEVIDYYEKFKKKYPKSKYNKELRELVKNSNDELKKFKS